MFGKFRRKQDLRLQLLALYLLFVIPVFILIFFFYINAVQRLREDVAAADLSLARAIALETDDMLLKTKGAVTTFAQTPAVIYATPSEIETIFAAGATARQDIDLFFRLSAEGTMLYHYPPTPEVAVGQNFSDQDFFQAARYTQEHALSLGHISPLTGKPVVSSVMPLFAANKFDGVVGIDLDIARLAETIKRIGLKQPNNRETKLTIIDASGQVIAHSEPDKLLQNLADLLPGAQEVLASREGSLIAKDRWGVEWLYTFTPIPTAGWGVIVQNPTRLAFASLESLQRGLIVALLLFGLGAFLFWKVLSKWVIIPLEQLNRYGASVGQNTMEAELDRETILPISLRSDQIGLLTRTLLQAERHNRRRLVELTTLNKTSATVVSTLDTQRVINTILDEVRRLLQVRQCALLVLNEAEQQIEIRASRGMSPNYLTQLDLTDETRQLPAYQAISSGQPVQVSDVRRHPHYDRLLADLARTEQFRSLLVVPLTAPHVSPAALIIYRADPHQFSDQEIDLATSFAHQAAIALEHAILFSLTDAELQKRVRFLSGLNEVGRSVSQSLLIDDIYRNAIDAVFEVMPAEACWFYLQRENETFLRLRAQRGLPAGLIESGRGQQIDYGQGIIGQVAQSRQSLYLEPDRRERWDEEADHLILAAGTWQSLVATPLISKNGLIGVLGISAMAQNAFTTSEIELLQAIGDQIALAVVNGRLYRRSREAAILEERNRVAREIHDTLAQGFTGILVQLQAAERLSHKYPEKAVQSLQEARELARDSLQEARRSVFNLRPTLLETLSLDQAIAQQVVRFETENRIKADFRVEGFPSPLKAEVEQNLYRIAQEALTNVGRHAQASEVVIALSYDPKSVMLTVTDNGLGLPVQAGQNGRQRNTQGQATRFEKGGFGLVGIKERTHLLGGEVTFSSPPAGGTQIKVVIPK